MAEEKGVFDEAAKDEASKDDSTILEPTKPEGDPKPAKSKRKHLAKDETVLEEPSANSEAEPLVPEQLVARSIRLVSPSGKSSITLQASDEIAGLWIDASPADDKYPRSCVAIYDDKHSGPVIGFYRDIGEKNLAMHFAICLDEHGIPQLQVDNGRGGYGFIGLASLLDYLKPDWR